MKEIINSIKSGIKDIIAVILMCIWGFYLNRGFHITSLFMDDVNMWSYFGTDSFGEFVFPETATHCRPVYWFCQWIELNVIGNHVQRIVVINIALLLVIAVILYFFIKKICRSELISWLSGMAFITSRFAYYSTTQLIGLIETLAILFTLIICILLYEYLHSEERSVFYLALAAYVAITLTHERYMVLLPLFIYVLIVSKKKKGIDFISTAIAFAFTVWIRYSMTGHIIPAGTGGTQITETFTIKSFFKSAIMQVEYMIGINAGEEYLCGITWADTSAAVKISVVLGCIAILWIFITFVVTVVKKLKSGDSSAIAIKDFILLIGFIIGCVTASSVTIRVEMRWIYASFMIMLILMAYMYAYAAPDKKITVIAVVLIVFLVLCIARDVYYRGFQDRLYLFTDPTNVDITQGLEAIFE